jgi:hypothetical protein
MPCKLTAIPVQILQQAANISIMINQNLSQLAAIFQKLP